MKVLLGHHPSRVLILHHHLLVVVLHGHLLITHHVLLHLVLLHLVVHLVVHGWTHLVGCLERIAHLMGSLVRIHLEGWYMALHVLVVSLEVRVHLHSISKFLVHLKVTLWIRIYLVPTSIEDTSLGVLVH
mmetsp:Transcript_6511/g.5798  ORF Transcript_6511/g.5798 Transcript_6511/m.5798 type:complete len:130 (-) Transcript_6511:699-1088(-)